MRVEVRGLGGCWRCVNCKSHCKNPLLSKSFFMIKFHTQQIFFLRPSSPSRLTLMKVELVDPTQVQKGERVVVETPHSSASFTLTKFLPFLPPEILRIGPLRSKKGGPWSLLLPSLRDDGTPFGPLSMGCPSTT